MFGAKRSEGRPVIGHLSVCAAWSSVAIFFGWKEHVRKQELEDALISLAGVLGPDANAAVLTELHTLVRAVARPDWTILHLIGLLIALRSLYSAVGAARLEKANAVFAAVGRRI